MTAQNVTTSGSINSEDNSSSISTPLKFFGRPKNFKGVDMLEELSSELIEPDVVTFCAVMSACEKANQ